MAELCRISVCPPDVSTDIEYINDNSPYFNEVESPEGFIIEFGVDNPSISVSAGQHIGVDDIIAYMNGIQVKSKISGVVTEVHNKYIIGVFDENIEQAMENLGLGDDLSSDKLESMYKNNDNISSFDKMNDLLKQNSYVNSFIKDYILRFRFADIANNSIEHNAFGAIQSYNTTERICESYSESADDIDDDFNDDMRRICDKDNVTTYCENNNMMGLKKLIDSTRKTYFNKILRQYNSVESFGYNSGRISDFMLYDEYLNYITSDKFTYDDENPYVVELFYHITTFMNVRERLEFNGSNIAALIVNFQTLCDDNIRKYWDDKMYDYYGRMKEIFQYDFYNSDDKELIQAKIYDEKRVTLYSKVLNYLTTLCNYVEPRSTEEKYKDKDLQSILNNAQVEDTATEKEMKELYNNLKKIAIFFVRLRKIETEIDPEYFTQFVNDDSLKDIFTLKPQLGNMSMREYIANYNNALSNIMGISAEQEEAYRAYEKKYTDPLKRLVEKESKILRELSDRAVNWYIENNEKIDDGSLFEQYQETVWSGATTIYKDNVPHEFYFVEQPVKVSDKLKIGILNGQSDDNPELYQEDGTETQYGVGDYEYWVKYCGIATIVNCMLPMYWATGLVISGVPIPMPIIYIPFTVINGRVTVVIGLGICGIFPLPMMLFVNFGDMPGSLIPALNIAVDTLRGLSAMIMNNANKPTKLTLKAMIEKQNKKIKELNEKQNDLKNKILEIDSGVKTDQETLRNLRKKRKEDPTSNKK